MRISKLSGVVLVCCLFFGFHANANNAACWGEQDDPTRPDISCSRITEKLLLSLRGQSEAVVRKTMEAPGRGIENGLHFLSNYSRGKWSGSGDVNVWFENERAASISASVDLPKSANQYFTWSAYAPPPLGREIDRSTRNFGRQPFCSDLSGKPERCSASGSMAAELTKMQMQGNLQKASLSKAFRGCL